jgi:proteasome lid subunit RPN8/RPN11
MVKISKALLGQIRQHGEETYPHECCGVLLGTVDLETHVREVKRTVRAGNTRADSPQNRYNIDPRELIAAQRLAREAGEDIIGFYHSHPDHPAQWSKTDFAEAHWYGCSYMITSVEQGKAKVTNSFALIGSSEEDKRFIDEPVEIISTPSGAEVVSRG